jgi:3-methyladenine DNA glycosylase/8-oxoguanine DNA glycosylase
MLSRKTLTPTQRLEVRTQLRTCLRLDEDFGEFHAEAKWHPEFTWIAGSGAGRMLRAPTTFEDVVKMICTTNCTWALTTLMVTNLVEHFGKKLDGVGGAFPTPETIAASSERMLRKEIKAGYRSPYLLELAERVAAGKLDLDAWRSSPLTTNELFEEMRGVKGIGPYAAGNILKLVGRYDYLGLDSWVRSKYYELYRNGSKVKDSTIERHYAPYGKWRGLFFWLDMTRYWHDEKFML